MRSLVLAAAAVATLAAARMAAAETTRLVEGEVIRATSRWTPDRKTVLTHSVVRTEAGEEVQIEQIGGSADGLRMVVMHAPDVLQEGQRVKVELAGDGTSPWNVRRLEVDRGELDNGLPFVRTVTKETRVPVYWKSGCAIVHFQADGSSQVEDEFSVMSQVLRRWSSEASDCSYLDLVEGGLSSNEVGFDGINLVVFREREWCRPGVDGKKKICYDSEAAGLTTLVFVDDNDSDRNGEIVDADIELNGVNFAVSINDNTTDPDKCKADVANTFTHEVGHLMGLDHTCWSGEGPHLNDHNGNEVPRCTENLAGAVLDATMYTFQGCGETKKASPENDDVAGVCFVYPLEDDPQECEPADIDPGGCCAVASAGKGHPSRGNALLVMLCAALFVLASRRRTHG